MRTLKKCWIVILAAITAALCLVGCNVRYEGVYELYSITQEVNGEEIVYNLGDSIRNISGEDISLTKDCLVYELKESKGRKGEFKVSGVLYYGGKTATGVWEKSKNKQLKLTAATNDGKDEAEEWWLVECDGKKMTYEWKGVTLTLKK